jgi:tellurite methyltransferase
MSPTTSVQFFETQFQREAAARPLDQALPLNPFETDVLPWLHGHVLDFGSGMGALACAAAARGCTVLALDGSATAVAQLRARAAAQALPIASRQADLRTHVLSGRFDTIASIGLLMFFDRATAQRQLQALCTHLRPGGVIAVNVLIAGTTYTDMFDPAGHCLLAEGELAAQFAGWQLLHDREQTFDAPGGRLKRFSTVVARKPG